MDFDKNSLDSSVGRRLNHGFRSRCPVFEAGAATWGGVIGSYLTNDYPKPFEGLKIPVTVKVTMIIVIALGHCLWI